MDDFWWGCLWGGSHWIRDGCVHPFQAEWIFCSGGGWEPPRPQIAASSQACCAERWGLRLQGRSTATIPRPPGGVGWGLWQMSHEGSMDEKRHGTSVVLVASGSMMLRSTFIKDRSWVGSSELATSQSDSSLKSNGRASRPLFSLSGQTTWPPHCNSFHTCSCSRWL